MLPIPTTPSLWALATNGPGVTIAGARFNADGLVHSESAVRVAGAVSRFTGGIEYSTTWSQQGASVVTTPAPLKVVSRQGTPAVGSIADYRPGGRLAMSRDNYTAIPKSKCVSGVWQPRPGLTGVFYVPCSVVINTSGVYAATIAAEGRVNISGAKVTIGQTAAAGRGEPAVVSGAAGEAISMTGVNIRVDGQTVASSGSARIAGAQIVLTCGVVASAITINSADSAAPMAARCLAP